MKNFFITCLLLLIFCPSSWCGPLVLATERGQIFVPEFEAWELGKDMFGMPFIYFSPQINGQRSNVSFTATGVDVEFNLADFGKDTEGYKKIKETWAQKVHATPQEYLPYNHWKNSHGHSIHQVGFQYLHNDKNYVEQSYYVKCRGRLIFAKSLRLLSSVEHENNFRTLINELDCGL